MNIKNVKDDIKNIMLLDKKANEIVNKIDKEDSEIVIKELLRLFQEYGFLKRKIKSLFVDNSVIETDNKEVKELLQMIVFNRPTSLKIEKYLNVLENSFSQPFNLDELNEEEIDNLGSEYFYSWFSHYEYIKSLYEIEVLIVDIAVPDHLKQFVNEIRKCYAFQQYNAANSLCRTILEIAMRDIGIKIGEIHWSKEDGDTKEFYRQYPPWDMRNKVTKGNDKLRNRIKKLYDELSSLIHGYNSNVNISIKETLLVIQDIYEHNKPKLDKGLTPK